jgi:hypothetical protein
MGNRKTQKAKEAAAAKKPYRKPEVRSERVFEVMALVCGKMATTQQQCKSSTKS